MIDIVERLKFDAARCEAQFSKGVAGNIEEAAAEIERLRTGQAVIAKQVGFYKPETPDFEFVKVPLGILRRALHCVPPPYPEDGVDEQEMREEGK